MNLTSLGFALARPVLRALDAEQAHGLTIAALKWGLGGTHRRKQDPRLATRCFGLDFANPLGLAAGFDKNAEVTSAMLGLGFGFVEIGTVTPLAQAGNPRPRMFRLVEDRAVINRMGFNNDGHDAVLRRLTEIRRRSSAIIGVNIGANKDAADRIADYAAGYGRLASVASYVTVNISSPNTPGLRQLQTAPELERLLARLAEVRAGIVDAPPLLLKIAPDLSDEEVADIARLCLEGPVDGVIISNTTLTRPNLQSRYASETGGLSGRPLFEPATRLLAKFYLMTKGGLPLIGAGGISDTETAWLKIKAGASLLQLYTALAFEGPALIADILDGLAHHLADNGYGAVEEAVGCDAEALAAHGSSGT